MLDCLIVGGGPAGLTAALYLVRFGLLVRVLDAGGGRAALIPRTRNQSAFPDGAAGAELLSRMRESLARYGPEAERGVVLSLALTEEGLEAATDVGTVRARTVLLATGVKDRRPKMASEQHDDALSRGLIRYCPICDGFEVRGRNVAILGTGEHGAREALFLRSYTETVTLVAPDGPHDLQDDHRAHLEKDGVRLIDGPVVDYEARRTELVVTTADHVLAFEAAYPALGFEAGSGLARALGADCEPQGCIRVDAHQRTSVPGLYAAGDVVVGLDQIARATSDAAIAATAIRNDLCRQGHPNLFSL